MGWTSGFPEIKEASNAHLFEMNCSLLNSVSSQCARGKSSVAPTSEDQLKIFNGIKTC